LAAVTVTCTQYSSRHFGYCVEWGVKLYSLRRALQPTNRTAVVTQKLFVSSTVWYCRARIRKCKTDSLARPPVSTGRRPVSRKTNEVEILTMVTTGTPGPTNDRRA